MAARLVGMIGLGVMGSAMAANLLKAGFKVVGYDPLAACRRRHRSAGGIVAGSALEVARSTRILITSLPSVEALAGVAKEISGQKLKGVIIIETSTSPRAGTGSGRSPYSRTSGPPKPRKKQAFMIG